MSFELIISIILGIGLAAACGFRVFLPLFIVSLLSHFGMGSFGLSESFSWIGELPAMFTFGSTRRPILRSRRSSSTSPWAGTPGCSIALSADTKSAPSAPRVITMESKLNCVRIARSTGRDSPPSGTSQV